MLRSLDSYLADCGDVRKPDLVKQALLQLEIDRRLDCHAQTREAIENANAAITVVDLLVWSPERDEYVLRRDAAAAAGADVLRVLRKFRNR
jgi:hypothetical protein